MAAEKKQALDGRRGNMFWMDPCDLVIIGRDTEDGREHPLWRSTATEDADPTMVASIRAFGVIVPITLRKANGVVAVTAGRGRTIAARYINERLQPGESPVEVPCILVTTDEVTAGAMAAAENHVRRIESPLVLADDAARLKTAGKSDADIAAALGVKIPRLRELLKLTDVAAPVRRAVEQGAISTSAAAALAGLPREQQIADLAELKESAAAKGKKKVTVKAAKAAKAKATGKAAAPVGMSRAEVKEAAGELTAYGIATSPKGKLSGWVGGAAVAFAMVLGIEVEVDTEMAADIRSILERRRAK